MTEEKRSVANGQTVLTPEPRATASADNADPIKELLTPVEKKLWEFFLFVAITAACVHWQFYGAAVIFAGLLALTFLDYAMRHIAAAFDGKEIR
jgi:hypothetical protein